MARQSLSVVAPVYNERDIIERFVDNLRQVLERLPYDFEIILVDDGATDGTGALLDKMQEANPRQMSVLHLSRNFGHQAALTAGMDYARADAVICMDSDLQHPPDLIPQLVTRWQEGFDIVQAVRQDTAHISWFKDLTARAFYSIINRLSSTRIEPSGADFRLLSQRVVEVFRKDVRERERFLRGLVAWVGFRSCSVEFKVQPRAAGRSKYSVGKMLAFARTGVISFSKIPLKIAAFFGFSVSVLSMLYGVYTVYAYMFFNAVIPGWASTVFVATFLGGCQLMFLGVIGEYLATIFDEIKDRPLYIVAEKRQASGREGPLEVGTEQ